MGDTVGTESGIFAAFACDGDEMADRSALDRAEGKEGGESRKEEQALAEGTIPDEDATQRGLPDNRFADEAADSWYDFNDRIHGGCDICPFCGGKGGDHSPECLDLLDSTDTEYLGTENSARCFCEYCGLCTEEAQASIAARVPAARKRVLVTERVPRYDGGEEIDNFTELMEQMEQGGLIGAISASIGDGRAACPLMWPL